MKIWLKDILNKMLENVEQNFGQNVFKYFKNI